MLNTALSYELSNVQAELKGIETVQLSEDEKSFNLLLEFAISFFILVISYLLLRSSNISMHTVQHHLSEGEDASHSHQWPSQVAAKSQRKIQALTFLIILVCFIQQLMIYD